MAANGLATGGLPPNKRSIQMLRCVCILVISIAIRRCCDHEYSTVTLSRMCENSYSELKIEWNDHLCITEYHK